MPKCGKIGAALTAGWGAELQFSVQLEGEEEEEEEEERVCAGTEVLSQGRWRYGRVQFEKEQTLTLTEEMPKKQQTPTRARLLL